jgi:hypothetical protein
MNIPGFTADLSFCRRSASYRSTGPARNAGRHGELFPALPIGEGGTTTKDDLEAQGYKCEIVSVGFWECTKPGSPTYWCSFNTCAPKPRVAPTGTILVGGIRGGSFTIG